MKEYWVNVYKNNTKWPFDNKDDAIKMDGLGTKVIYRIHVKMKPVYIQNYGRGIRTKINSNILEKWLDL